MSYCVLSVVNDSRDGITDERIKWARERGNDLEYVRDD
jgi:hypothetical protein